jgi:hypothetical protein
MKTDELTYGNLMTIFGKQFPGLEVDDIRPNGRYELYVWIKNSPTNLIATYYPKEKIFRVKATYEDWPLFATSPSEKEDMVRYTENDVKNTERFYREFVGRPYDEQTLKLKGELK